MQDMILTIPHIGWCIILLADFLDDKFSWGIDPNKNLYIKKTFILKQNDPVQLLFCLFSNSMTFYTDASMKPYFFK